MAGVQRVSLNNLNINLKNGLIVGIIIAKNSPRTIGLKKRNGESRGVTSFTLRDSEVDTIFVDVWGSEYFALTFYERFLVGDVVEISSPKISLKGGNEMFRPLVSSPFDLCVNEGMSEVSIHTGDSFTSFLPLLHIPSKPSAAYYGLSEVLKLPEQSNNVYVDLLVVVKAVKPAKSIRTKTGVDMSVRSVEVIDNTTPASVTLDMFDLDTIQRAEEWRPLESVLFVADARVSRRGRGGAALQLCARSVVTHQPHRADAEALRLHVRDRADTRGAGGAGGGEAAAWAAWSGARAAPASAAQARARLAAGAPFCAALHALLTHLDLDDLAADENIEELRVRFADHTGELNAWLPISLLDEIFGYSSAQLKALSAEDRAAIRWKVLLEQCTAKLAGSPPRLLVLSLRRSSQADPIPFKLLLLTAALATMEKPEKNDFTYEYKKKRKEFGRQCLFEDHGPEVLINIPNNSAHYKNYILRNPVHVAIQNTGTTSEHWVNSVRAEYTSSGINHIEGGWPKDINMNDPEATQRYVRKIEKDDAYIHAVMHLGHSMEHNILQNHAIDMYQTYYSELPSIPRVERSSCHTVNVYREPGTRRPIRSLSWQADGGARLATAYADVDLMGNSRYQQVSYIWDIENANAPELTIKPTQPLLDLQYNPRDQHILVGGMLNGQVGWWDMRKGSEAAGACPPHVAHRDLVQNVLFINSKTGAEFFSSSPDGVVKWWDTRNMSEPSDSMIIDLVKLPTDTQSIENAIGISALEYEPTIPTRFMVGTETGAVIGGNRKGKNPLEKLPTKYEAHLGPVYALQRNPTFLKNFLTVGDWTARVWSEDCRESSILWTYSHRTKLTDGAWNPIRFSLMLVTQWDGCLSCWDLLRRRSAPIVTAQLCDEPLLRLRPHESGLLVACGSSKGAVYLAELSQNLGTADKNDKQLLTNILERENKRERILEARLREMRLRMRHDRDGAPPAADADRAADDRDLAEATAEYMQTVSQLQAQQKTST